MVQLSRELVDDESVDLQGYLAMETGRALGNAFGAHLVAGTGTGQPRGILTTPRSVSRAARVSRVFRPRTT
jgi:HK97 family phage major capsid protein